MGSRAGGCAEEAGGQIDDEERAELEQGFWRLQTTDMAVVVSPGQNEIEEMRKLGLDIVPHRRRMVDEQPSLEERFKDPKDPLALVFVCAMWLTGFDAPSCTTIYLDKPMRNHTLMQTIAFVPEPMPMRNASGAVVYYLFFAGPNRTGAKIVGDIFRKHAKRTC